MATDDGSHKSETQQEPPQVLNHSDSGANADEPILDLVGWDGPRDPENPMNWPDSRKWTNIGLMSLLTIISPLGSSMFAPAVPQIMVQFGASSSVVATLLVSIYFIGYAFGPLLFAPLSEIYGRVWIYHAGNFFFVLTCVGAALSTNTGMFLAFRLLMGAFGSAPTTVGVGSIIDMITLEWRGRAISIWAMGPLLGPCIGPVIGGYIIQSIGWRWVYWILAIVGGVLGVLGIVLMQETYAPTLLERKCKRLRKETGNDRLRSSMDTRSHAKIKLAIIRPLKLLFTTPIITIIALYVGVAYGILNLLIATFSFVYRDKYGFSEGSVGLAFLPAGLGMMAGVLTYGQVADILVAKAKAKQEGEVDGGQFVPEIKLTPWATVPAGIALAAGLFMYGWTIESGIHWIVPMISVAILAFGLMGVTMSAQNYQIDCFPESASSGTAAITLFRSLVGAMLPLAGLKLYENLGLGWGNSVLAFLSLAFMPILPCLYYFGHRLRQRPKRSSRTAAGV